MNTETKTIRILTADDHALLRTGIESLVEIEPDMELVAQAMPEQGRFRAVHQSVEFRIHEEVPGEGKTRFAISRRIL